MKDRKLASSLMVLAGFACVAGSAFGAKKKDKPVVIAWESAPREVDPRYALDANSQYLENLIHCSLIDFGPKGDTVGDLAKAWEWKTRKKLEVSLKDGGQFSDGSPVTAEDVVATYQFFKRDDVKPPSPRKGAFKHLKSVEAKGKHKVLFTLDEASAPFVMNLVVGILPKKLAAKGRLEKGENLVGCGPYNLAAKTVGSLKLTRNPHYSLSQKPNSEAVEIKIVKDESTRFAKLRAGEVDIVQNGLSRDKLDNVKSDYPRLKLLRRPGLKTTYLGFNMKDPIVGEKPVRKAISLAIKRKKIIKYVLGGFAVPAATLLTPDDPYYNDDLEPVSPDLDQARKILDKAGFKNPDGDKPRFKLTYKTTTNTTRITIAKAIASQLGKIGIDVKVVPLEWGRFKADVEKGKVQMWSLSWVGFKDPDIYRYVFATESFIPDGGNRGRYSNPELDKLLAKAKAEPDTEKRKKLYHKIQEIVADDLPYVFLWHEENFAVVGKDIQGFQVYADGRYGALPRVTRQ